MDDHLDEVDILEAIDLLNEEALDRNSEYIEAYGEPWAMLYNGSVKVVKFYGMRVWGSFDEAQPDLDHKMSTSWQLKELWRLEALEMLGNLFIMVGDPNMTKKAVIVDEDNN